MKWEKNLD